MAFLNVEVHDAEVTSVRMDREKMLLQLELVLHTRETVWFDFQGAEEWSLPGLGTQNVLFDIRERRAGMAGTAERCAEWPLGAVWTQKVLAGELALYEFEPSVGMRGYVLARAVTETRTWEESSLQGVSIELDFLLKPGWKRTMEDGGNHMVTGPAGPEFVSEIWRIAQFITYGDYMRLEKLDDAGHVYRLMSRARKYIAFQVTFHALHEDV
ncbi:hypothetical protein HJC22_36620 [Corallococcus exiguus]|uniref:hypothetical protein n=1 Tax=Corallococcus exiguus TaxID=83462 RepID=UPI0014715A73|nr:hypothetical protein [Corallococcus exiguus]NNC21245.1 hypothetical protein [Corallococcus exiguus]